MHKAWAALIIAMLAWVAWKVTAPPITMKAVAIVKEVEGPPPVVNKKIDTATTIFNTPGVSGKVIDPLQPAIPVVPDGLDMFSSISNAY